VGFVCVFFPEQRQRDFFDGHSLAVPAAAVLGWSSGIAPIAQSSPSQRPTMCFRSARQRGIVADEAFQIAPKLCAIGTWWERSGKRPLAGSSRVILAALAGLLVRGNRLTEVALAALGADFAEHGPDVIKKVRKTRAASLSGHCCITIAASAECREN
jgi:hypothetical protein